MLDNASFYDDLKALGINLVSDVISFMVGLFSGVVLTSGRALLRPRFWSEMLRGKVAIVVGAHGDFDSYEASGMIGTGDALALAEFAGYFKQNKFTAYEVVSARSIGSDLLAQNLILIGGPDGNEISRDFVERTIAKRKVRFGNIRLHEISFELEGRVYAPTSEPVRKDAAAIIYHESPYSEDRHVILVSGCFGHGTLAAAQLLCRSGSFARRARWLRRFEAAVTCEVIKHGPTSIEVQCLA